ncbi:MAG: DUF1287 domain-containing protein [Cardiobacteriaceae bacterium]|nr:DUF1287 domain-containing protein [Cardiobacteriaceae bacterium]
MKNLLFALIFCTLPAWATDAAKLVADARAQIGITTGYDPAYRKIPFPMGDVAAETGVCTDVIIRAYRGQGIDLQALVNADMRRDFAAYPKHWGLTKTDSNIDHRRVPNLQTYFRRHGASLPISDNPADYQPGDIVSWMLPGNRPHIGIVSEKHSADGTPLIIHNIGEGTKEEDILFAFPVTGHYRYTPNL